MATRNVQWVCNLFLRKMNDPTANAFNADNQIDLYNETLLKLWRDRPEIFVGALTAPPTEKTVAATLPYEEQFGPLHADMMVAEAKRIPDEEENESKAERADARARQG